MRRCEGPRSQLKVGPRVLIAGFNGRDQKDRGVGCGWSLLYVVFKLAAGVGAIDLAMNRTFDASPWLQDSEEG